jgi:hypothetical protein
MERGGEGGVERERDGEGEGEGKGVCVETLARVNMCMRHHGRREVVEEGGGRGGRW